MYLLSVSVVLYHSEAEEVKRVLEQLSAASSFASLTIVDNSPSAAIRDLVEASGVRYLCPARNLGYGPGHNLAMAEAIMRSKYHLVCNPDVSFETKVLEELSAFMDRNEDVGLVMPQVLNPDGTEQRLCKRLPAPTDLILRRFAGRVGQHFMRKRLERYEMVDVDLTTAREVPSLSGCFMFLRSKVLLQVGSFDPRYFMYMEDVDLCRRVGAAAKTVFYPRVSITHGYAKGSYKDPRLLRYHLQSAARYFNKWGWFFDRKRMLQNQKVSKFLDAADRVDS